MRPEDGRIKPRRTFSSVLFPAPLGPRTATNSPSSIEKLMSCWITLPPRRSCTFVSVTTEKHRAAPGFPFAPHFPSARSSPRSWLSIQSWYFSAGGHGLGHRHDRYPRRLCVVLQPRRDGGDGLLVVDQHLDLLALDLVLRRHHRVRGRVVALCNGFLELERRKHLQPHRVGLVEKDRLGQADGGAPPLVPDLRHLLAHAREGRAEGLEVLRVGPALPGRSSSGCRPVPARPPGRCRRRTRRVRCRAACSVQGRYACRTTRRGRGDAESSLSIQSS